MAQDTATFSAVSGSEIFAGAAGLPDNYELSVIIPVYNEEGSLDTLYGELADALEEIGRSWEVIFVDDGSKDSSWQKLARIATDDRRVKVIRFVRNFGQTAALAAGIDYAAGEIIIPMDADLQNNPNDIGRLIDKLEEGFDVVSGWRKDRKDALFTRLVPSWAANQIISLASGVKLHDYGCSLKAYRKEVIKGIRLYGEMHRFVPIYATWMGASVTEIPVAHQVRRAGQSKYGLSRTFKVILDLLTVQFLSNYSTKPIYVFGSCGILSFAVSFIVFGWMLVLKYFWQTSFVETPLPVLVAMFFMLGVQFLLMGLLAEMLVRTYHESQDKRIYMVKSTLNVRLAASKQI